MEMFRNLNSEIGYNFALKSYEYVLLSKKKLKKWRKLLTLHYLKKWKKKQNSNTRFYEYRISIYFFHYFPFKNYLMFLFELFKIL